jgi:hypothetical protein
MLGLNPSSPYMGFSLLQEFADSIFAFVFIEASPGN